YFVEERIVKQDGEVRKLIEEELEKVKSDLQKSLASQNKKIHDLITEFKALKQSLKSKSKMKLKKK
ncbi:hypothetical protein HYS48_00285, partial [Candidatus Woesearchaeota archaeon]|nr:hypothetical protein [Candidatus Woesearchaeota archaeon]